MRVRRIEIGGKTDPMPATLGVPDGYPPGPAVVVIQEWWGLNANIESFVERFASIGFAALAPDLYRGVKTAEPDEAQKMMMALDKVRAVADIKAAVTFLLNQGASKVGVVGFCMGGFLAWETACEDDRVAAAVPFYGITEAEGRTLPCALQAHFGTEDHYDLAMLEARAAELAARGDGSELFMYEGADHAVMNDTRPQVFDPKAAALAWDRAVAFLTDKLGAPVAV